MSNDVETSLKVKPEKKKKSADENYASYKEIHIGYFIAGIAVFSLIFVSVSHYLKMWHDNPPPPRHLNKKVVVEKQVERKIRGYKVKY